MIEKLPKYVSALIPIILSLSIVYDFGYFSSLGLSFSDIPTTISDHLRSSIVWLPTALICIFFISIIELFTRRLEQGMTEEEIINNSSNPQRTAKIRKSPFYFITAITVSIPIVYLFGVKIPVVAWQFFWIITWFLLHDFIFGHQRIASQITKEYSLLIRWIPAVILWVLFSGYLAGEQDKGAGNSLATITTESVVLEKVILRAYDKFYLLYSPDDEIITILSSGSVLSIDSAPQK
uniref:Uncharacterized protein n=1 Tax=Aliivibrio wodanis TaxID=80852 RepID=A0A5Q4YZ03_9GAMM|nr:hypothetical protein AW0309160_03510 [Aliivibrio wodanis]